MELYKIIMLVIILFGSGLGIYQCYSILSMIKLDNLSQRLHTETIRITILYAISKREDSDCIKLKKDIDELITQHEKFGEIIRKISMTNSVKERLSQSNNNKIVTLKTLSETLS